MRENAITLESVVAEKLDYGRQSGAPTDSLWWLFLAKLRERSENGKLARLKSYEMVQSTPQNVTIPASNITSWLVLNSSPQVSLRGAFVAHH